MTGVEPQFFIDSEVQYDGLTRLIVTQDMTERKTRMIELGDAFIAFPGGTGTLEAVSYTHLDVYKRQLPTPSLVSWHTSVSTPVRSRQVLLSTTP